MKNGEISSRWLAFPHALDVSELLHKALVICVSKYHPILRTIVIQQAVDPVDGLGTELDPFAPDEECGADLKRQIGVELPQDRGHFGKRGHT